ncbi:MAG: DUF4178 domain-containing protein [Campylobacterota bacterium]|nr:DUF4178 domain-containing protein [Campylobacterota bacterium]
MSAYAINCPNCGGSLDVLGGGRQIVTFTCKYCGSILDVEDEYRVLGTFLKVKLPSSPFRLGMIATLKGVEFTIIGMVAYNCEGDKWIDYMLHSPTHGYAWLSFEDGNTIFSRRTRDLPSRNMVALTPKESFEFDGRSYRFYEQYRVEITYVQGELTWVARKGDVTSVYDAISPPYGLSYERSGSESEYVISEYLEADEVYKSFNITSNTKQKFHPLKPFHAPKSKTLSKVSLYFGLLSLFMIILLSTSYSGTLVGGDTFTGKSKEISFHIDDPSHLVELDIYANVDNDWIYYDISVINQQNSKEVYSLGEEVSYYYGYDGGESWTEGSQSAEAFFKVDLAGDYLLKFDAPEYHRAVNTSVTIKQSVVRSVYFIALMIFFLLAASIYLIQLASHHTRLWKHLQEDDDD